MDALTPQQQLRLLDLVANPPPDSKIAAAKKAGVDLILMVRLLGLTPHNVLKKWSATFSSRIRWSKHCAKRTPALFPEYEVF